MMEKTPSDPVLSRVVAVDEIGTDGLAVTVEPTAAELSALARVNGLVALTRLRAPLRVRPEPGGGFRVTGEVEADVTQTCVVSLEPFDSTVREPVDALFLLPARHAAVMAERAAVSRDETDDLEEPDLVEHGRIDVGALTAEHLTLGLDPYPKRPGATLPPQPAADAAQTSPFAVLLTPRGGRS